MTRRFLPALDQTLQPPAPNGTDSWANHDGGLSVIAKYSAALSVPRGDVAPERLKSVPSPWARLLLFEQALYNQRHPAHLAIQREWRGLMGCIGLAPHLGLVISTRLVDVATLRGVVESLRAMAPRDDKSELWDQIALISVGGELVGGTSPRTLVFSGIRGVRSGRIPFQASGRLVDPTAYYIDRSDSLSLALVLDWLDAIIGGFEQPNGIADLESFMGRLPGGGSTPLSGGGSTTSRAALLLGVLQSWRNETRAGLDRLGRPAGKLVERITASPLGNPFPQDHPARRAFAHFVQVHPAADVAPQNDLQVPGRQLVIDPGARGILLREGHAYTGTVALPRGMARQVRNGRFVLDTPASVIGSSIPDLGTFFEKKLIPVRTAVRENTHVLEANGVAYLFPFHRDILKHLTDSDLVAWTRVEGSRATGVTVKLEVPLGNNLSLVHEQQYAGGDVYEEDDVVAPFLTVWPDFEAPKWEHFFYVERQAGRGGLELVPAVEPMERYADAQVGLTWGKLKGPPRAWIGSFANAKGILVTGAARASTDTGAKWNVAIDFGSTHTRVFRSSIGVGGGPVTSEVSLTPRARPLLGDDKTMPYVFFVSRDTQRGSAAEPPSLIWLPLERVLERGTDKPWMPPDGVMYWDALENAPQGTAGLRGNLKWHRDDPHERAAFHSYVSQLYLAVAAEAAAQGATIESLRTAYPSVLPTELRTRHRHQWRELEHLFGVKVDAPRSESDAVAAYFVDQGAAVATNLLAVDVGGSTSDLTVWMKGQRTNGDSIRLAGDILSRLVSNDPQARQAISAALQRPPFNRAAVRWDEEDPSKNGMILNSLLRTISENPRFRSEPSLLAHNLYDGPGSPGERVVAHLAYLFGTVSFILGLMVRRTGVSHDRYDIRFAGRGSEFLHWLEALGTGASKSIPSVFFRAGLGGSTTADVSISLPGDHVKQEVGRGLLLPAVDSTTPPDDRVTFVGETGFGDALPWSASLDFPALRSLEAPTEPISLDRLENLRRFVETFGKDPAAAKAAHALGVSNASLNRELRDRIHQRLFGGQSVWAAVRNADSARLGAALLEPMIVVEAKTLLEHATGQFGLFA